MEKTTDPSAKIDIVMFNMSSFWDWDHGVVNRNYHVLHNLVKENKINKIVGVDFLPRGWKKAASHYVKNILWEIKSAEMVYGDLTSACYQRSDKIYAYTTIDSIFSMNKVGKELRRVEKILNLKNVVFWSYNPMFTEFLGKLNEKLFVFDTVDNWMEHPTYPKMMPPKRLKRNYFKIADKADLIFTVSQELKDFYAEMSRTKDVHWIPNGVDFEFFNRPSAIKQKTELDDFDKKIIGYFGTIESRLDLDLLAKVAEDHQDKEIAICGPIWPIVKPMFHKKMHKYKNVHTFGRIDYKVAPAYMNRFDVAIMPHKISEFTKSNNPMKLYEYLACGRPLVSTPSAGTEMFKDLIYLAEEPKAFSNLINKALTEDSPEKQFKRKNAIKAHSWKSRVDTMTDYLFKKLNL